MSLFLSSLSWTRRASCENTQIQFQGICRTLNKIQKAPRTLNATGAQTEKTNALQSSCKAGCLCFQKHIAGQTQQKEVYFLSQAHDPATARVKYSKKSILIWALQQLKRPCAESLTSQVLLWVMSHWLHKSYPKSQTSQVFQNKISAERQTLFKFAKTVLG